MTEPQLGRDTLPDGPGGGRVGNTRQTVRSFNRIISKKTPGQLMNKLRLGATLITNFENEKDTNPRAEDTIQSLEQQMMLLRNELNRRYKNLEQEELDRLADEEAEKEGAEKDFGPFDQVIGVNTLKLTGKNDMG